MSTVTPDSVCGAGPLGNPLYGAVQPVPRAPALTCPPGTTPVAAPALRSWQTFRFGRTLSMNIIKEIGAYISLMFLAVCVLCAAIVAAKLTWGILSVPAALAAAALTFGALRRPTGRMVAAAVDSL